MKKNERNFKIKEQGLLLETLYVLLSDLNKKKVKSLLAHSNISVNGRITTKFNYQLVKNDVVTVNFNKIMKTRRNEVLDVLYEDDYIIAVNKLEKLLTVSTDEEKDNTLFNIVKRYVQDKKRSNKLYVVHRLDQDTSGVVIFAKNDKIKNELQENWNDVVKTRGYVAIVNYSKFKYSGTIKTYLAEKNTFVYSTRNPKEGKLAITHYRTMKESKNNKMLEIYLDTGRKNQIRVHMKELGTYIIGDKKYGIKQKEDKRMFLHANKLDFIHPVTKKLVKIEAKLPTSFNKLINKK